MKAERLEKIRDMENNHFWFVGRRMIILHLIRQYLKDHDNRMLDIGCGTGDMIDRLHGNGFALSGMDKRRISI